MDNPIVTSEYNEYEYWNHRYTRGGNSGGGSYKREGACKIKYINIYIQEAEVSSILDLGCGDGNIIFQIAKENPTVNIIALDISDFIINKNLKDKEKLGLHNIDFRASDVSDLSLSKEFKVDCVLCLDVLFHIREDVKFKNIIKNIDNIYNKIAIVSTWGPTFPKERCSTELDSYEYYRDFKTEASILHFYKELILPSKTKAMYIYKKDLSNGFL